MLTISKLGRFISRKEGRKEPLRMIVNGMVREILGWSDLRRFVVWFYGREEVEIIMAMFIYW
jgi:hypothetical protein